MTDISFRAEAVRCPHCGAPVHFDAKIGKLCCEHCGTVTEPEDINIKEATTDEAAKSAHYEPGTGDIASFRCTSCGAEMYSSGVTAALSCPYCGNNTVVPAQISGEFAPDYVLPFAKTREEALAAYENYRRKNIFKRFMQPRVFRRTLSTDDIQGVYVPFRLYDGTAEAEVSFVTYDRKPRLYTETLTGTLEFENVPADASRRIGDDLMDNIEPYELSELKTFSAAYLPGMLAERPDEKKDIDEERAKKRVKKSAVSLMKAELNHKHVDEERSGKIKLGRSVSHYALLPVWLLTTRYKDSVYRFAMNGQTGKFIGELPMSAKKTLALAFLALVLPIVLCMAISTELWAIGLTIGAFAALAIVLGIFWIMQVKDTASVWDADYYIKRKIRIESHTEKENK